MKDSIDPERYVYPDHTDFGPMPRTSIKHLDGVAWHAAPLPPKKHVCWAQTIGYMDYGFSEVHRCACGAIHYEEWGPGEWLRINERRDPRLATPESLAEAAAQDAVEAELRAEARREWYGFAWAVGCVVAIMVLTLLGAWLFG
jgi:hypothetical protein